MIASERIARLVAQVLALALGIHEAQLLVVGHDVVQVAGGHGLDAAALLGAVPTPTLALASLGLAAVAFCGWWLTRSNRSSEPRRAALVAVPPRSSATVATAPLGVMARHRAERAPPQKPR